MNGGGTASENSVFISGGTINGNVYATRTTGNSTHNTVTLTGGTIKGELGANNGTANSLRANTLNIGESSANPLANSNQIEVHRIKSDFANINFYLSENNIKNNDVAVKLTGSRGSITSLNNSNISVNNLSNLISKLSNPDDKYYLLKNDNGGTIKVNEGWLKNNQEVVGNIF